MNLLPCHQEEVVLGLAADQLGAIELLESIVAVDYLAFGLFVTAHHYLFPADDQRLSHQIQDKDPEVEECLTRYARLHLYWGDARIEFINEVSFTVGRH